MENIIRVAIAVLALALSATALGQYPSKPIRLVAPLPAGSATDNVARVLAPMVSQALVKDQLDSYTRILRAAGVQPE